jgi:hypothetical protein
MYGGHGSTFLKKYLKSCGIKVHIRPDIVFNNKSTLNPDAKLSDKPTKNHLNKFRIRTLNQYSLNLNKTIEENMIYYLNSVNKSNNVVIFTSEICRMGPFFTNNNIENVIYIVRHPVHAMISFLAHQHKEKMVHFKNGLNSIEYVKYYAKLWNDLTSDHLNGGSKIVRYEFAKRDVDFLGKGDIILKNMFTTSWKSDIRNYNVLDSQLEAILKDMVRANYERLYDRWEV